MGERCEVENGVIAEPGTVVGNDVKIENKRRIVWGERQAKVKEKYGIKSLEYLIEKLDYELVELNVDCD